MLTDEEMDAMSAYYWEREEMRVKAKYDPLIAAELREEDENVIPEFFEDGKASALP